MDEKLQKLAEKLYQEGIEKAKLEAETILNQAKEKAEAIISEAKKKEEEILRNARKEKEDLEKRVLMELKSAIEQAKSSLKQELVNFISINALKKTVSEALSDVEVVKDLIIEICKKWDISSGTPQLEVILPEKKKEMFEKVFAKKVKELLSGNVVITFEGKMEEGFKVVSKDGNFVLSFTDSDFNQFFASYLKPKTKELLFSGDK